MDEMSALTRERTQLFYDIYDGKIPERVPVNISVNTVYAAQYCGLDPKEAQWNISLLNGVIDKVADDLKSDIVPAGLINIPLVYHILGGSSYVMSEQGVMQHAERHAMEAEEYEEFISDPYKFIVDIALPRIYRNLDTTAGERALVFARAYKARQDVMMQLGGYRLAAIKKYGLANTVMGAGCYAPFDFVTDQLRGFTNILKDIRRIPDKVLRAAEAMLPLAVKAGSIPNPQPYARTFIPLHMPTFMRASDFEKYFWPTFIRQIEQLQANGMGVGLFCEHNWMRYLDYLADLPGRILLQFEFGDPGLIKEKVGQKHIISGLYPVVLLKTGTTKECIEKAGEMIDILAPGGGYIFSYDKSPLTLRDAKPENIIAVNEFVREYAVY